MFKNMADKVEKVKKRKRNPDGSVKPSKRVAIEENNQVNITLHQADEWAPIIGMPIEFRNHPYLVPILTWKSFNAWGFHSKLHCPQAVCKKSPKCSSEDWS
jgi:hypothetical protein